MKILITGGTGFIGKILCRYLQKQHHELTILSRTPAKVPALCGHSVHVIDDIGLLMASDSFDAIINLAGAGIADARWTKKRKQILIESRINTTKNLLDYIERADKKPNVLISGSAVGYYGDSGNNILSEGSKGHDDFSHQLCEEWETYAQEAESMGVRVCILRTGLVIGHNGGFVKRMLPVFKLGLGGCFGNGKQWMSWIHVTDLIIIISKLIETDVLRGVFNATAPTPVTNREFTQTLGRLLSKPTFLSIPAFVLNLLFGEMAELFLGGQRVKPVKLEKLGYKFKFPTLEGALSHVLNS